MAKIFKLSRFVLGATDPEMAAISRLLEAAGFPVVHATAPGRDGNPAPVGGPTTYKATVPAPEQGDVWVETAPAAGGKAAVIAADGHVVDHHEVGDPGYGRPPSEVMEAASIGQIISLLAKIDRVPAEWERRPPGILKIGEFGRSPTGSYFVGLGRQSARLPKDLVVIAACDHCLTAAFAGLVPGVNREAVLAARVATAAAFERRPEADLRAEIKAALAVLESAPGVEIGGVAVADLRGHQPPAEAGPTDRGGVPGLNHAGPMTGRAYVALIRERTGKLKAVLGGDGPGTATEGRAAAGFKSWAEAQGYRDAYGGDPARGFAGAYVPE